MFNKRFTPGTYYGTLLLKKKSLKDLKTHKFQIVLWNKYATCVWNVSKYFWVSYIYKWSNHEDNTEDAMDRTWAPNPWGYALNGRHVSEIELGKVNKNIS